MGKFDGVLLASDYDATLGVGFEIPQANLDALEYFKAQGGRFTVATGRALRTFGPLAHLCPINAPVILANGAQLYDLDRRTMLAEETLPRAITADLEAFLPDWPMLSVEVYHGDQVYLWNPNQWSRAHCEMTRVQPDERPVGEMPHPWFKVILQNENAILLSAQADFLSRYGDRYEAILSAPTMLELTGKGCTKGGMVLELARRLGIGRENVYCVGDNENDIPMLRVSAIPFAPANSIPLVRELPGVHLLPRCEEGAVGALIRHLDTLY